MHKPITASADASNSEGQWQPTSDTTPSDDLSLPPILIQYWQAAMRWRLVIAGIIAGVLAIAVVATLLMAPLYTARAQIEISREQKNITNVPGLEGAAGPAEREFYDTQYALLKAESLAERIARKLKLADNASFFEAHGVDLPAAAQMRGDTPLLSQAERKQREGMAVRLLLGNVDIAPIRNSRLVDIKYTSRSREWSTQIANTWSQEFIGATMDRQFASTADARRFLEERLSNLRSKLEQSERDVVTYASSRDIVTLGTSRDSEGRTMEPRTLTASDLEALNSALVTARTERIAAEARARTSGGDASPEAITNTTIQSLRTKRAEISGEYARLLVQFEPGYPAARALKKQMDALDAAIDRETTRISGSRQIGYAEALKREQELTQQVEALKVRMDQQQRDTIQYNIYLREADTNRQLYDALLQRYKEIGVAGTVGATNIVVVDQAKLPTEPSAPSLPKNIAIALLLGLGLAAAAVLALEQIDEGIRHPGDVEKLLNLPLLGNVPKIEGAPQDALVDPKTDLSEAYFSIRTVLALATSHGLPRSLAVTSTQAREGKSTSALALATILGRTGKRVLLIDADMRSPSVHKLVDSDNSAGLSNLLAGEDDFEALVRLTARKGLSILPAGPTPPSAAELLSTERLGQLIEQMLGTYDHIIIDAPPILGLADAPLLGRAAEGAVFVIEAESAPVRAIRNALRRLQVGQNHVFGAIITKVDYGRHRYGYGYGYGYGHNYGYGEQRSEA